MNESRLAGIAIGFLICLCASSAEARTPASPLDLASADWSLKQAKILNAESKDVIWKSLNDVPGWSDLGPEVGELCSFQFVDLRDTGELSLTVSYDNGGTADCNDVAILDKTPAGIEEYDFDAAEDLSFDSVDDINGARHHELILDGGFAGGGTGHCIAAWPVIYAWTGNAYSDVSSHYKSYYKRWFHSPSHSLDDCTEAEAEKIERFLGSPEAGIADAIRWSESDDPSDRQFAADILGDIGTPRAIEYLHRLSNDPDRNVAWSAKTSLHFDAKDRSEVSPTIHGELLTSDPAAPSAK